MATDSLMHIAAKFMLMNSRTTTMKSIICSLSLHILFTRSNIKYVILKQLKRITNGLNIMNLNSLCIFQLQQLYIQLQSHCINQVNMFSTSVHIIVIMIHHCIKYIDFVKCSTKNKLRSNKQHEMYNEYKFAVPVHIVFSLHTYFVLFFLLIYEYTI